MNTQDRMLAGLVRVVARDGSVWWVKPDRVADYAQIESAILPISDADRQFHAAAQAAYWRRDVK